MAFLARRIGFIGILFHSSFISISVITNNNNNNTRRRLCLFSNCRKKRFSSSSTENEFAGKNAYDVLGIPETSTFEEIKASFRKLAKQTHPDLLHSHDDSTASQQFIQILAAYEILSDSEKRIHYDMYLSSQRKLVQKLSKQGPSMYTYDSCLKTGKQMEVVEWLRWYRFAIHDILSQKKVISGSGYFDVLEGEFYSAIHFAYHGPVIESMELLPDCFEAEERSVYETPELLHLVSGRNLFGIVYLVNGVPELSNASFEKLTSFASVGSGMCQPIKNLNTCLNSGSVDNAEILQTQASNHVNYASDAYRDLELHISGRVVAVATRSPPTSYYNGVQKEDSEDHIHVFLSSHEEPMYARKEFSTNSFSGSSIGSKILLGTVTGLGTSPEEGSCFVYDSSGTKTHVIMKHRTLLVKHMHWYQTGDEVSVCECRCSRARLPPSKFWLFEPRSDMHDIGGWYVETFGRNKKGRTVPSQRQWDVFDAIELPEKRLHPAMYLLTLAYRTLDLEDTKRRKRTVRDFVEPKLTNILRWCKKFV